MLASSIDYSGSISSVPFRDDGEVDTTAPEKSIGPSGDLQLWGTPIVLDQTLSVGISGNVQIGGAGVILMPPLTPDDLKTLEMVQFRGTPLPLAEQMQAGLDPARMEALVGECNNGNLSVNDLAAELMILMLNNALANKSIERQMRAELAQMQYQNGMKIADMIGKKGELAYKKAVTQAVTKMATVAVDIATTKIADYIANQKLGNVAGENLTGGTGSQKGGFKYTPEERDAIRRNGAMTNEALKAAIETTGNLICADLDLEMSQIDSQKQAAEATGKLLDSIASSIDSSIRAQDQAIQFIMSMLDKINSLAHDTISKINSNIR
jgi:hypothetical protein